MKINKIFTINLAIITIMSGLFFFSLYKVKSEIYFNIWLNQIIQKAQSGELLIKRDMEYGLPIVTSYKIFGKKIGLEEIFSFVTYDKKTKILNIDLVLPGSEPLGFDNLPKDLSKKICSDAYIAVSSISFTVNGEEFDRFKDFIKYTKCNFLTSNKETYMLTPSGGWIFKIKDGNEQPTEIKS
jgi:hypothetical protein